MSVLTLFSVIHYVKSVKQRLEEAKYVILVFSLDLVHVASKAIHADYKQEQIF